MHLILALLILGLAGYGVVGVGSRVTGRVARNGVTPGARNVAGGVRQRGQKATKTVKTKGQKAAGDGQRRVAHIWHETLATNWLEGRRHRRAASPPAARVPLGQRIRQRRATRRQPAQPAPSPAPQPASPPSQPAPAPAPAPASQPTSQPYTPPPPPGNGAPTNGKAHTPMSTPTTSGASTDLFTAAHGVVGQSLNGGIQSKRRGIKTLAEATDYFATLLDGFARRLAEPDQGYKAAVWEPISEAVTHLHAAASKMGESDTALDTLARTPLGDVAASNQQAPHQNQVNTE